MHMEKNHFITDAEENKNKIEMPYSIIKLSLAT